MVEEAYGHISFGKNQAEVDDDLLVDKNEGSLLDDDAWTAFYGSDMPSIFSFRLVAIPSDQAYSDQIVLSTKQLVCIFNAHTLNFHSHQKPQRST